MRGLRRHRLPGLLEVGLDDDPGRRHGPPGGAPVRRHRSGALSGLRLRDGCGEDREPAPRRARPALLPRKRPALPGAIPMRVPLSWLREYGDVQQTPEELAERLTLLGMEVKGVEQWGADWRSVVVGELLTVEKHPYADRLHLTTVNVGSGEPLHIVCGANNIAPGQRVPVALPGAVLPGERRIERTEKMGIASEGMLCSGYELHITSDAEGILILPPSTPLGLDLSDLYGDVVLDGDRKE